MEQVTANGPAAAARIKGGARTVTVQGAQYTLGGDIITAVDGKTITTFDELLAAVDARRPGDKLTLTLQRGDTTLTVTATLAVRPPQLLTARRGTLRGAVRALKRLRPPLFLTRSKGRCIRTSRLRHASWQAWLGMSPFPEGAW